MAQFVPMYPFADVTAVSSWESAYRSGGHQPWHRDAGATALSFAGFLGFTAIDIVTSSHQSAGEAHVGVGYRNRSGVAATAAVIHLVRYGSDDIAPWEVVGTDDTTLTVTRPTYGARVTSPVTVGGTITGVDENIVVTIRQLTNQAPLGTHAGVPAGGQSSPWSVQVSYGGAATGPLIIVASTGGHLQAVERFAVTGART